MGHHDHEHHAHTHEHDHEHHHHDHAHEHTHEQLHAEGGAADAKTVALLQYMLEHNIHHAGELSDFAGQLSGEAQHLLLHAVEAFEQGNGYLARALEHMK